MENLKQEILKSTFGFSCLQFIKKNVLFGISGKKHSEKWKIFRNSAVFQIVYYYYVCQQKNNNVLRKEYETTDNCFEVSGYKFCVCSNFGLVPCTQRNFFLNTTFYWLSSGNKM